MAKIDTLTCDDCGAAVFEVYEPATILLIGTVLCKKHGNKVEGLHFHMPPDAEVPAGLVYVDN
jgi:3-keto-L-gulonate-6-phosphate decarboxylase